MWSFFSSAVIFFSLSCIAVLGASSSGVPNAKILLRLKPAGTTTLIPVSPPLLLSDFTVYMSVLRSDTSADTRERFVSSVCSFSLTKRNSSCFDAPQGSAFQHTPLPLSSQQHSSQCVVTFSSLVQSSVPQDTDTSALVRLCGGIDDSASEYVETAAGFIIERIMTAPGAEDIVAVRQVSAPVDSMTTTYISFVNLTTVTHNPEAMRPTVQNSVSFADRASPSRVLSDAATRFYFFNRSVFYIVQNISESWLICSKPASTGWRRRDPCGLAPFFGEIEMIGVSETDPIHGATTLDLLVWGRDARNNQKICRMDVSTGSELWSDAASLPLASVRTAIIADDRIILGGVSVINASVAAIVVLSASTGQLVWLEFRTILDMNATDPVAYHGYVYFTVSGKLAFRKTDLPRAAITVTDVECTMSPSIAGNAVYCVDELGAIVAFDLLLNSVLWRAESDSDRLVAFPPRVFPARNTAAPPVLSWVSYDGTVFFATGPTDRNKDASGESEPFPDSGASAGAGDEIPNEIDAETSSQQYRFSTFKIALFAGLIMLAVVLSVVVWRKRIDNRRYLGLTHDNNNPWYDTTG